MTRARKRGERRAVERGALQGGHKKAPRGAGQVRALRVSGVVADAGDRGLDRGDGFGGDVLGLLDVAGQHGGAD